VTSTRNPQLAEFRTLWLGQIVSMLGSGVTAFALAIWIYTATHSAGQMAIMAACGMLPGLLLAPLLGVFLDRWDLRRAMLLAHLAAGLGAAITIALFRAGTLQYWHLYVIGAGRSCLTAVHWPAFTVATQLLVPVKQLGRAAGATQFADAATQLLSPVLGGLLVGSTGLSGVLAVEVLCAGAGVCSLLWLTIPERVLGSVGPVRNSFLVEVAAGWNYLAQQRGLVALLGLSCVSNAAVSVLEMLSAPVVLAVASSAVLGLVRSLAGAGMLAGSVLMTVWGGPRDRIVGVIGFQCLFGAFMVAMGVAATPMAMAIAGFSGLFFLPLVNGCAQTLWQTTVEPHVQGRVFSLRRLPLLFRPLGYLVSGLAADKLVDPYLRDHAGLNWLTGHAGGRGGALLLVIAGFGTVLATAASYCYRPLRDLEQGRAPSPSLGAQ